ncbi:MAG: hypothetical protein KGJ55_12195, partial [Gammaproteobacteria bacterium]|nr:hypothetical protein [Gammaproteobacteria bacterium]
MNTATPLSALNRILIRAVLALGENGERERACRLAAQALAALRHDHPREAERLNGVLHALTRTTDPPTRHTEHVMSQTLDVRELIPM